MWTVSTLQLITFTGAGGDGAKIASGTLGSGTAAAKVTPAAPNGTVTIRGR